MRMGRGEKEMREDGRGGERVGGERKIVFAIPLVFIFPLDLLCHSEASSGCGL